MRDDRGPWYLFTALILGFSLGLLLGWIVIPVRYVNTVPSKLRADMKDRYRALIAEAYMADGSIERATARLDLLGDPDKVAALALQAQRAIAENRPKSEVQALTRLMLTLSQGGTPPPLPTATSLQASPPISPSATFPSATDTLTPTPVVLISDTPVVVKRSSSPSPLSTAISTTQALTPTATLIPTGTPTPMPTPGAPFVLFEQKPICDDPQTTLMLQVETLDAARNPVPGVEVIVQWPENNEERFFTGLKPEISLGYADFAMSPGILYRVRVRDRVGDEGAAVADLSAPKCKTRAGEPFWGALKLTFVQPP